MGNVANIAIRPMNVAWGEDTAQVQTVTTRADVASDLQNDYFFIYDETGAKYHVWFNVATLGVDPAPGGSTAVAVAIAAGATANTIATAVAAAIDALAKFVSTASQSVVTITNAAVGYAAQAHEGVGTNFSFSLTTEGMSAADVGFVDGEIELSVAEDLVPVTAEQTGTNELSHIRTGKQVELTINFKETSAAQLKKLLRAPGGSFTPAGAGGTEVVGMGDYRDFTQTLNQSSKLVLHPSTLGSGDKSGDYTFHKAYPMLESIPFSGEAIQTIPVKFKIYLDTTKNTRAKYYAFGDGSQTLT